MDAVKPYTRVWRYSFSIICLLESPNYKKSESLVRSQVSTQGNFLFPLSPNAELETLILPFPRGYWLPTLEEALIFSASVSVHVSARFPRNFWPKLLISFNFRVIYHCSEGGAGVRSYRCGPISTRSVFFLNPLSAHLFSRYGNYSNKPLSRHCCLSAAASVDVAHVSLFYPLFIICDSNQLWSSIPAAANVGIFYCHLRLSACMRADRCERRCVLHCLVWKIMHPHGAHRKFNSINYIQNTLASDAEI